MRPHTLFLSIVAVSALTLLLAGCPSARRQVPKQCPAGCAKCDEEGNCINCTPGEKMCVGQDVVICNDEGKAGSTVKTCSGADTCVGGECTNACASAAAGNSYIGCDYWPVTLANSQLNKAFSFAVAVANPASSPDLSTGVASVTVTRGTQVVKTVNVQPGAVEVIQLPWVQELALVAASSDAQATYASALVANGAYHLTSNLPVTVYQFNPLEYETASSATCFDSVEEPSNKCHSYTNDASLLIPTPVLGQDYYALARQTFGLSSGLVTPGTPGFFAVVGTEDNTTVTVTYNAYVLAGNGVATQAPGSTATYTLNAGSVLQVMSDTAMSHSYTAGGKNYPDSSSHSDPDYGIFYVDGGPQYDLTGSHIVADKPVAVFGGHACAFVPYYRWACDHLEEQLLPTGTLGQNVIVAPTKPLTAAPKDEPNVWRIMSGTDGNSLTFDPPTVAQAQTLNAGEYFEFESKVPFKVSGTGRVAVAQFIVGQNYNGITAEPELDKWGDPSFGLGIPVEQYRSSYNFLVPSTYVKSYVTIIAPANSEIMLNNMPVQGTFTPIGQTGYGYLWLEIQAGAHHLSSSSKFGITVAGVAPYTSYLYPGGLDLNVIPIG